jgi:2-oxoacid:acceptor oxidoreductase gamma subunit (pyruvate/2-ketoisovalerate family)
VNINKSLFLEKAKGEAISMKEIRLHGRGGQGTVSAADLIAVASVIDGKYGTSLPMYGAERRGTPVVSFVCIDDQPVRQKTQIYTPSCLIVLDSRQRNLPQIYEGVKPGGFLVLNFNKSLEDRPHPNITVAGVVDATKIAIEEIGIPAFNTCMLGAFAAATGWVKLESILLALEKNFSGELLKKNMKTVKRGYQEVMIKRWQE